MLLRESIEKNEQQQLSPFACLSSNSLGRDFAEEPCDIRTVFQRDRDRIIHCKSFRRLKYKTQVFISPEGDHYRTRLTHTLEVMQIASTISRALRLNEDLTVAIALGHDLGHTPFGHIGEKALNRMMGSEGFEHNRQSLRIVKHLEKEGKGLNLTKEVQDGILNHTGQRLPMTLEGQVVRIADRIAYINHDIDDAIRGGIICNDDLPAFPIKVLGDRHSKRIDSMVKDLIYSSIGMDKIVMSPHIENAMTELRDFMFSKVYLGSKAKDEENKAEQLLETLFKHFIALGDDRQKVCDYIAGMTDRYAVKVYKDIFLPHCWNEH